MVKSFFSKKYVRSPEEARNTFGLQRNSAITLLPRQKNSARKTKSPKFFNMYVHFYVAENIIFSNLPLFSNT